MGHFEHLGRALRLLRARVDRKQQDVAADAGISGPMLSIYETGKRQPSLSTLDRILTALGATLDDLLEAIDQITRDESPGGAAYPTGPAPEPSRGVCEPVGEAYGTVPRKLDLLALVGLPATLPAEEEQALRQLLASIFQWLCVIHSQSAYARQALAGREEPAPEGQTRE